jgi:hypothetical protein
MIAKFITYNNRSTSISGQISSLVTTSAMINLSGPIRKQGGDKNVDYIRHPAERHLLRLRKTNQPVDGRNSSNSRSEDRHLFDMRAACLRRTPESAPKIMPED